MNEPTSKQPKVQSPESEACRIKERLGNSALVAQSERERIPHLPYKHSEVDTQISNSPHNELFLPLPRFLYIKSFNCLKYFMKM